MFIDEDPSRWILLERVASTQDYLKAGDFAPGRVVIAREQSAGRGTGGRDWFAAPDRAFIFSALFSSPAIPVDRLPYLPLLTGLAVLEAARAVRAGLRANEDDPVELGIKWPNDVLLRRAGRTGKLAGVLVETETGGSGSGSAAIGRGPGGTGHGSSPGAAPAYRAIIGVGLNWFGLPAELEASGIAAALFARDPGRPPLDFAGGFIARLNTHLAGLTAGGPPVFLHEIRRHCWLTGRLARIDGEIRRVRGIADSGALLAQTATGGLEEIYGRRDPLEIVGAAGPEPGPG